MRHFAQSLLPWTWEQFAWRISRLELLSAAVRLDCPLSAQCKPYITAHVWQPVYREYVYCVFGKGPVLTVSLHLLHVLASKRHTRHEWLTAHDGCWLDSSVLVRSHFPCSLPCTRNWSFFIFSRVPCTNWVFLNLHKKIHLIQLLRWQTFKLKKRFELTTFW